MKKVYSYISFILLSMLLLTACGKEKTAPYSLNIKGYKKWKKPTSKMLKYAVPGHGKSYRFIYANETAFYPKTDKNVAIELSREYRDGSIVVKELYKKRSDINKKEPKIYVVVKNRDHPSAIEGWLYYVKNPGKKPLMISSRLCAGCHEAANDEHPYFDGNPDRRFRDYLFSKIGR